ncbi:unnamed protein product, partial [Oppiella nova]
MSSILNIFNICDKIPETTKRSIKLFHVLNGWDGPNILFVTNEDRVYGMGANKSGSLGLGHNNTIESPEQIPGLNDQNIREFMIGSNFVIALTSESKVYGWGCNGSGQLGRDRSPQFIYLKPGLIDYFAGKGVTQISCGYLHSLALTTDGRVYGWGDNTNAQLGFDNKTTDHSTPTPVEINLHKDLIVKQVYCFANSSFAVTVDGEVYSWGYNYEGECGHDISELIVNPRLINSLVNVRAVSMSQNRTYFITDEGLVYFCGQYNSNTRCYEYSKQMEPKLLETDLRFTDIHMDLSNGDQVSFTSALTGQGLYKIMETNEIFETFYDNMFDFYANVYQLTYKTVDLNDYRDWVPKERPEYALKSKQNFCLNFPKIDKSIEGYYDNCFDVLEELSGSGGFSKVFKVRHNLRSAHVVQYFNSWTDRKYLYLQTEYCAKTLQNILEEKGQVFSRDVGVAMNVVEYYMSCQIFSELLECVKYLHELSEPVVHGSLKPQNILIDVNANYGSYLKLCDTGLTGIHDMVCHKELDESTRKYLAPEVIAGKLYDHKSDIYRQQLFEIDFEKDVQPD